MKDSAIYSSVFMGFFMVMTLISCKEQKTPETNSTDRKEDSTLIDKPETTVNIADYFPGVNFMTVVAMKNNGLNLSSEQEQTFAKWRAENHNIIEGKMRQIARLEAEIKSLSQERADAEKIFKKQRETGILRREVATIKLLCRDLIIETLETEQFDGLVVNYEKNHPFVERRKMMEIMQHVNPVPNYMQLINTNISELNIVPEQKDKFDAWSAEHHPQMMEMANQVIHLEKEIYQNSLQREPKDNMVFKIQRIEELRAKIVETKTSCRNMVAKTLSQDQWKNLVDMTNVILK